MRCSCRQCGVYMVQEEYGLQSGCKCPSCGAMCHDCMGSVQQPMTPEEIKSMFMLGMLRETQETETVSADNIGADEDEFHGDWRKNL